MELQRREQHEGGGGGAPKAAAHRALQQGQRRHREAALQRAKVSAGHGAAGCMRIKRGGWQGRTARSGTWACN